MQSAPESIDFESIRVRTSVAGRREFGLERVAHVTLYTGRRRRQQNPRGRVLSINRVKRRGRARFRHCTLDETGLHAAVKAIPKFGGVRGRARTRHPTTERERARAVRNTRYVAVKFRRRPRRPRAREQVNPAWTRVSGDARAILSEQILLKSI